MIMFYCLLITQIDRTGFIGITFIGSSISKRIYMHMHLCLIIYLDGSLSIKLESRTNRTQESGAYLPGSIKNLTNKDDIILSFILYNRSTLFPVCDVSSDTVVGSTVIGASVGGVPDGTILPDNVTINFTITQEVCIIILLDLVSLIFLECHQPPLCILGLLCRRSVLGI